jgi:urease accessory protein
MSTQSPGAVRIGIGGPVGSGKTRLVERLLPLLAGAGLDVAVITNDLVTDEDAQRVRRSGLIDPGRVLAVETGACPHTAIREDPSANLAAAATLERRYPGLQVILVESGGDNLAATFTSDLVDYWIFVIDTAAGDDIPRKRGIGLLQADLLVVNKTDLAPLVGADLDRMRADCAVARPNRPTVFSDLRSGAGLDELFGIVLRDAQLCAASPT